MLDENQVTGSLHFGFIHIEYPAIYDDGTEAMLDSSAVVARVSGNILAVVAEFFAVNAEFMPAKQAVIRAASKAIDAALDQIGRPWLAALIEPAVKAKISLAIEALYDAIVAGYPR